MEGSMGGENRLRRRDYRKRLMSWAATVLIASAVSPAGAQVKSRIRIATASPSLSYLPIYTAVKKGFFAKRGLDVEMIQMNASLTAPALLNRSVDYTTIPSAI